MKLPGFRVLLIAGIFAVAATPVPSATLSLLGAFAGNEPNSSTGRIAVKESILLAQADVPQSGLPGGASSLQESYQDWQVTCTLRETGKRCVMSQQQADPKTRQRVLAIELEATMSGQVTGMLVLPFGLALDAGVSMNVDDGIGKDGQRFQTCLPAGCIVSLDLADKLITAMRAGTMLNVAATPLHDAQPVAFGVSLKGFSSALDRTLTLTQ